MTEHSDSSADEARTRTLAAVKELGLSDVTEADLSYITPDLLNAYEGAMDKQSIPVPLENQARTEIGLSDEPDYPCWIGNSPVFLSGKKWQYQNNNASDGCDLAEHLCGTGRLWTAEFSRLEKDRYCASGLKGVLGWP